ncbi:hypothetical protein SAMN02910406_01433 [Ruminococcus albus]|uniref:Uncharacterized protein n=1 Tax=Ruminococcus albus TaxID=1264 RepID=A0A1I1HQ05_RUMAL|nr:hypothetical protein SAMN02910406_01433 [Ruminococcus albus]
MYIKNLTYKYIKKLNLTKSNTYVIIFNNDMCAVRRLMVKIGVKCHKRANSAVGVLLTDTISEQKDQFDTE